MSVRNVSFQSGFHVVARWNWIFSEKRKAIPVATGAEGTKAPQVETGNGLRFPDLRISS